MKIFSQYKPPQHSHFSILVKMLQRLKNSESYNEFYFDLINKIDFASVSGFPSLEELKETTVLPLDYV